MAKICFILVRQRRCLQENKNVVQFIYSCCYPDKRGIEIKGEFLLAFKSWKDKKKFQEIPQQQQQQQQQQQSSGEEDKENDEKQEAKLKEKREKRRLLVAKNEGLKSSKKKRKSLWMKRHSGVV